MAILNNFIDEIENEGFTIIPEVFDSEEVNSIISCINKKESSNSTFRKSADLFAIRQFFKEVPEAIELVLNAKVSSLLNSFFGEGHFVVKSIYFDKPGESNWFVSYHQDLTISVVKKVTVAGYGPWTVKQNQFAVQPPEEILKSNFTLRVHLDNTDENNGALRVLPGSHNKGVYRAEQIDWTREKEVSCSVPKGGIMIMRPLLMHASSKSKTNERRRVIHIEYSNQELPAELEWSERIPGICR